MTSRQHRRQFLVHDQGGRCHVMSQAAPIICDQVDRLDRGRHQFTNECRVGVRNHDQSGVVKAASQHDRRKPTLVVDTITVMETVKAKHRFVG